MKIEFLEQAQAELDDAFNWYEAQQEKLGYQFLNEVDAAIRRMIAFPESYSCLGSEMRRCLIKRFPYGIIYASTNDGTLIIAVAHLHRRPNYWLGRII